MWPNDVLWRMLNKRLILGETTSSTRIWLWNTGSNFCLGETVLGSRGSTSHLADVVLLIQVDITENPNTLSAITSMRYTTEPFPYTWSLHDIIVMSYINNSYYYISPSRSVCSVIHVHTQMRSVPKNVQSVWRFRNAATSSYHCSAGKRCRGNSCRYIRLGAGW